MARGGARAGAGRPYGSRDTVKRQRIARSQAAAIEYLRTNDRRVFDGDSLALAVMVYKDEDLPLKIRLDAAYAAMPFEHARLNNVDTRISLERAADNGDDYSDALLNSLLRYREAAEQKFIPAPEIVPPEPAPARHARRPPMIDADEQLIRNQEPDGKNVAETLAPDAVVLPVSAPCPEPPLEKPVDPDLIEINTPTRSGVITRYVPRLK
jgi:hypothetical protein